MSVYLPFGIALFQANVTQLRSVAEQQELLLVRQSSFNGTPELAHQNWLRRLSSRYSRLTQAQQSYIWIACGMLVQVNHSSSESLQPCRTCADTTIADHYCGDIRWLAYTTGRLVQLRKATIQQRPGQMQEDLGMGSLRFLANVLDLDLWPLRALQDQKHP